MWEIWANLLLPKALKSCPKSKKSPDLVTLVCFCHLQVGINLFFHFGRHFDFRLSQHLATLVTLSSCLDIFWSMFLPFGSATLVTLTSCSDIFRSMFLPFGSAQVIVSLILVSLLFHFDHLQGLKGTFTSVLVNVSTTSVTLYSFPD